jgi:hypothetical protein
MKKLILGLITLTTLTFVAGKVQAQTPTFVTEHDTVNATFGGNAIEVHNNITALAGNVTVVWREVGNNFPSGWTCSSCLQVCDNKTCYTNGLDAITNGSSKTSLPYSTTMGLFKGLFDFTGGPSGTHYITFNLRDSASSYNKDITFVINKWPTSASSVTKNGDDVTLYPNPANDEVNVLFDGDLGVKNIAVYNVIGKSMVVYRVAGNSAKMDISKLPSGVYFLRMSDIRGQVVATKKFTKQ